MLIENPKSSSERTNRVSRFCAVRRRKADGAPNVGGRWQEPLGSCDPFIQDQKTWEVVFYDTDDKLPD